MLELINEERTRQGLHPVTLGNNNAAQLHAEASLRNCVSSHWGIDGLKPYMRYSLAGGHQSNRENWAGRSHCIKIDDGYLGIGSIPSEIREAMEGLMSSPGHRENILDRWHRKVNIGLAWDEYNFIAVQHFQGDYVNYDRLPGIEEGILSLSGTAKNGVRFEGDEDLGLQVFYDPPPRVLTGGQVSRTYCYDPGLPIASIRPPLKGGQYYTEQEVTVGHRFCPDPYEVAADAAGPTSPEEAHALWRAAYDASRLAPERPLTLPWITALEWVSSGGDFSVVTDVTELLAAYGPGVYTVMLWGLVDGDQLVISQYPIFHEVKVPDTYDIYRDDPLIERPDPTPTPTVSPARDNWGPVSGDLPHNPTDKLIRVEYADVSVADMVVEATFVNPYDASENPWDYGFILRDNAAGPHLMILATSRSRWAAITRAGPFEPFERIAAGTLPSLEVGAGGLNHLMVLSIGGRGWLFVNGDFVSAVDLSSVTSEGDVAVITGAYTGDEVAGAVTRYEDFRGFSLKKRYGPTDGRLVKEEGFVSQHESGVRARDLVMEAHFINPPGEDWDYGFIIRNPRSNRLDVIAVGDDARWFHRTRNIGDEGYTAVASGQFSNSLTTDSRRNHLLLIAMKDAGWLFMDQELVSELDLSHNQDEGEVSAMANFWRDHRAEVDFYDVTVWTP